MDGKIIDTRDNSTVANIKDGTVTDKHGKIVGNIESGSGSSGMDGLFGGVGIGIFGAFAAVGIAIYILVVVSYFSTYIIIPIGILGAVFAPSGFFHVLAHIVLAYGLIIRIFDRNLRLLSIMRFRKYTKEEKDEVSFLCKLNTLLAFVYAAIPFIFTMVILEHLSLPVAVENSMGIVFLATYCILLDLFYLPSFIRKVRGKPPAKTSKKRKLLYLSLAALFLVTLFIILPAIALEVGEKVFGWDDLLG